MAAAGNEPAYLYRPTPPAAAARMMMKKNAKMT